MTLLLTACASAGPDPEPSAPAAATDAEWRALAGPRPAPLADAPRISFTRFELNGAAPWSFTAPVAVELAVSELVIAGLLRRSDVQLVERRRFTAAMEAERAGRARAPEAPMPGVSPGTELTASAVWLPLGAQVVLEVRIRDAATGAISGSHRASLPPDAELVGTARQIVSSILVALDEMDRLPAWNDPVADAAPDVYRPSGIPAQAVERFLRGLAAEELWNWESARRSYEAAAASSRFVEAEAALARTARLRTGGTLGES